MHVIVALILSLTEAAIPTALAADTRLPAWVSGGSLTDGGTRYVVCSQDGLDPEESRVAAEGKCLASAAKLNGMEVTVRQKTVESLGGTDANEVTESKPITVNVRCDFTDRFMEPLSSGGYRVWLRCKVAKVVATAGKPSDSGNGETPTRATLSYKRGLLFVTTSPKADKLVVNNQESGERVIDVSGSNVTKVELHEGDTTVMARLRRYADKTVEIPSWKQGDSVSMTIFLDQEM